MDLHSLAQEQGVDWPYESNKLGAEFLENLPLSPQDRAKIAHGNAERVLRM